jgi:protein-S-isoprenylcysteine O-methyltransferase Ste14
MDVFRIIAAVLLITALGISGYHRRQANMAGDKISLREEGWPIMVLLRLAGFAAWLSIVAWVINPRWMAWSAVDLPLWVKWAGVGLAVSTVPLLYWIFSSLGKNISPTVIIRQEHDLVTHGPYRYVRHPLYSVGLVFFIGLILMAANWFIGLMAVVGLIFLVLRTPIEEAKLIERFGDEYREYMQRTGRFVPRLIR